MAGVNLEVRSEKEAALCERLHTGKHSQADVVALRKLLRECPHLSRAADVCAVAFRDAVGYVGGDNALFAELAEDRRRVLRTELGYAEALPVEKLLIDEIILCWLRHYDAERRYTEAQAGRSTMEHCTYWEKKVAATQRRYLRAVETFARVGKLLRSVSMQVNIAEKQVNVAGKQGE